MTESQFTAWLLFLLPVLCCFGNQNFTFNQALMIAVVVFLVLPLPLLIIAENEFIKDCKKGYSNWEESIFPQKIYRRWYK